MRAAFAFALAFAFAAVPASGTVHAETCQRTVSIAPQVSGGEGTGKLTFKVYSGGCAAAGEVGYEVVAGTARAGIDFRLPSGRLRWAAGETAVMTITGAIVQDTEREDDLEDFTVRLTDPDPGVRIAQPTGQGRILDDDRLSPIWDVDDVICPDLLPNQHCGCAADLIGWEPMCTANEFHLSAAQPDPAALHWSTIDGTALAGVDYVAVTDQVQTVAAGETAGALPVRLLPRPPGTPSRWFYVRISAVSTGGIVDGLAVYTIA